MRTLTVRITDDLDARVNLIAERRGTTRSEVVRAALALVEDQDLKPLSMRELVGHLAGCVDGPADLSSAARHMDGFGQ